MDRLNEKIRPYLLRRQKSDVEKSLVIRTLTSNLSWITPIIFASLAPTAPLNLGHLPMQVPLDETIIWVELTLFQKKCYK